MAGPLPEDIYAGGPQNPLLRHWLSKDISRDVAEASLKTPMLAPSGSFIVRRSESSPGDYAISVVESSSIRSYKVSDLGLGQVGLKTGQAFASLEHLLEFFYDNPFPEPGDGHVPLRIMHQYLVDGQPGMGRAAPPIPAAPRPGFAPMPQQPFLPMQQQMMYDSIDDPGVQFGGPMAYPSQHPQFAQSQFPQFAPPVSMAPRPGIPLPPRGQQFYQPQPGDAVYDTSAY
eukprot:m.487579 g.487579  ORF g.487579 m.487579 type:complete len:229 (+) comp57226_c0_seq1:91-777(+)